MTASEPALAKNLLAFVSKLRALEREPVAHRLARFFEDWRSLQGASVSDRTEAVAPAADPGALRRAFGRLQPLLDEHRRSAPDLNICAVSGLGTDEVRASAVLAWFLDPRGSHGEGRLFADALWSKVGGAELGFDLQSLQRTATEVCPLADVADRVDVVLEGDHFAVFIEVKIYAGLQPAQLERYVAAAERSASLRNKPHAALIYLAPYPARLPSDRCRWLSWRRLARAFRLAAEQSSTPFVRQVADHFAQHIERYR